MTGASHEPHRSESGAAADTPLPSPGVEVASGGGAVVVTLAAWPCTSQRATAQSFARRPYEPVFIGAARPGVGAARIGVGVGVAGPVTSAWVLLTSPE